MSIAELKTQIQSRKFKAMEISNKIDGKVRDIRKLLSGYPLTRIKDLQLPLIAQVSAEASSLQAEYLTLLDEVETAEKELNG